MPQRVNILFRICNLGCYWSSARIWRNIPYPQMVLPYWHVHSCSFYLIHRYASPKWQFLKRLDGLLIVLGFLNFAPYNLTYYTTAFYVSFLFMNYIRKRYVLWFQKYTYVMSSGFSAGIALSAIIIFFAVQYHPVSLNWWGNEVMYKGIDGDSSYRLKQIPDEGYFGPEPGSYVY